MAKVKKGRELNGIVLLDKALGISSNKALQSIKFLSQAQKAGHTGSLDPLATGLLPLCFGEATKFSQYLLDADKVYLARIKLGQKTTTGDCEGAFLAEKPVDFAFESLVEVLSCFLGAQKQVPSMYSALKHEGKPLYKLAREGKHVERAPRDIFIHELSIESNHECFEQEQEIRVRVHCSKGTYIRNLAEDIGEALECGAHLSGLRRIQSGSFTDMHTEAELRQCFETGGLDALNAFLLPVDAALEQFPAYFIDVDQAFQLKQGKVLSMANTSVERAGMVRIYEQGEDETKVFLGLGECLFAPEKGEVSNTGTLRARRLLRTN